MVVVQRIKLKFYNLIIEQHATTNLLWKAEKVKKIHLRTFFSEITL